MIAGAGAAGVGIARLFRRALEREGLTGEALRPSVAMLDSKGLIVDAQDEYRRDIAWTGELAASFGLRAGSPLLDVVRAAKPTALVGVSGVPGRLRRAVVSEMAASVQRPLVFPLSNPTSSSEAPPADLLVWTTCRALIATGARSTRSRSAGASCVSARATTRSCSPALAWASSSPRPAR